MESKKRINGAYIVLGILIILAFFSFIYQTIKGLQVTGLREPFVWGVYVVNYTVCLGMGAGILMLLAIISNSEKISYEYKLLSSMSAFISLCLAGVFIILDLGCIDRFYYMLIYPQVKSPLFKDFIILNVFLMVSLFFCLYNLRQIFLRIDSRGKIGHIISLIYKFITLKKEFKINSQLLRISNYFILIFVIGLYLLTPEVFTGMKAHPEWNTSLFSIVFLFSALLCGAAVLALIKEYKTGITAPFFILYRLVPIIVLIGVILMRSDTIISAYYRRWLPFPRVSHYIPALTEVLIVLGVYSGGIAAVLASSYFTKLLVTKNEIQNS